jgi:hypothetical protein
MTADYRLQIADWRTRTAVILLTCCALAAAYSGGPPNGKTGRPGEGTCLDCHSGGSGARDSAAIGGFGGTTYTPDRAYSLVLHVSYAGQYRWGFEMTTVEVNSGRYAGQLIISDPTNTQVAVTGGRGYLKHTSAGTRAGQADSCSWSFRWQAPAQGTGPVIFYWCNNAANNDGTSSGDVIIRDSLYLTESSGIEEGQPAGRSFWRYANPARNRALIEYDGAADRAVRIYSATGRLVRTLAPQRVGDHLRVLWDGLDSHGRRVPEASYFVRLGDEVAAIARVQLVR